YLAKGWALDAARELGQAAELEPDNLEIQIDLGRAYVKLDGWEDVSEIANAVEAKDPKNPWILYFRASALNAKQQPKKALEAIDAALAADPEPIDFKIARGEILTGLDRFADAEKTYRAVLAQNAKNAT